MANPEHVAILKKGVEVWNEWRQTYIKWERLPNKYHLREADVSGLDLRYAKLRKVNFNETNLSGANLYRADLRQASLIQSHLMRAYLHQTNFYEADLRFVNMNGSDLREAHLIKANLYCANLSEANLRGADLSEVDLRKANLRGADLHEAIAGETIFGGVDLSAVKGLETVEHRLPSTIGIDTIIRSQGMIPEIFLRKAGIPDSIIESIPSLISSLEPIDYYTCFLSYSSKDQDFVERLYADLQARGVRCWFAPHDMHIGDQIRPSIDESIRLYDKLLLILSEHSVASQWVEHEVETALGKELEGKPNVLFPIRLDEAVMNSRTGWASHIRLTRNIGDFTRWKDHDYYKKGFRRLLRDLKSGT